MAEPHHHTPRRTSPPMSVYDGIRGGARPADWRESLADDVRRDRAETIATHRGQVRELLDQAAAGLQTVAASMAETVVALSGRLKLKHLMTALEHDRIEDVPEEFQEIVQKLLADTDRKPATIQRELREHIEVVFGEVLRVQPLPYLAALVQDVIDLEEQFLEANDQVVWSKGVLDVRAALEARAVALGKILNAETEPDALELFALHTLSQQLHSLSQQVELGRMGPGAMRTLAEQLNANLENADPGVAIAADLEDEGRYILAIAAALFRKEHCYTAREIDDLSQLLHRRILVGLRESDSAERLLLLLETVAADYDSFDLPLSARTRLGMELRECAEEFERSRAALMGDLKLSKHNATELAGTLGEAGCRRIVEAVRKSGCPIQSVAALLHHDSRLAISIATNPPGFREQDFAALLAWLRDFHATAGELGLVGPCSPIYHPERFTSAEKRSAVLEELRQALADPQAGLLVPHRSLMNGLADDFTARGLAREQAVVAAALLVFGFAPAGEQGRTLISPFASLSSEQIKGNVPPSMVDGVLLRDKAQTMLKWLAEKGWIGQQGGNRYRFVRPEKRRNFGSTPPPHIRVADFYRESSADSRQEGA